jgi:hypothetical protein
VPFVFLEPFPVGNSGVEECGVEEDPPAKRLQFERERISVPSQCGGSPASNCLSQNYHTLQGYLAHNKPPHPSTLQYVYVWGPLVVLAGVAIIDMASGPLQ